MTDARGPAAVHTIETTTHGRYLLEAPTAPGPHPVIVGFHGYAENAAVHLDALRRTVGDRPWTIVSVQALHRFYTRGDREVVASWMTRQDRELAIADNVAYVQQVLRGLRGTTDVAPPLVFAGFSQGVAMAYRAAVAEPPDGLVLLAGDLPPDVELFAATLPPLLLGRGRDDPRYTEDRHRADLDRLTGAGVAVQACVFDGAHEWTDGFAEAAGAFLDRCVQQAGGRGLLS